MPVVKSIRQLRSELAAKTKHLARLQQERGKIAKRLAALDRQIATLAGQARPGKPAATRKAKGRPKVAPRKRRRATGKPLAACIKDALAKAKDGLSVTEIVKRVTAAGYKSRSKDFYAIVAKTLLTNDAFARVKRGVYKVA